MSAVFTPTRHKLTVEDYHKLGEAGILTQESRAELIQGELIDRASIGGAHMGLVNRLNRLLVLAVRDRGVVSIQNPVTLPPDSEPQPDVAILTPGPDTAGASVPRPEDVLLLIEVADSTLAYDRNTKLMLYAKAGVAEAWIVNIQAKCVEVYRGPSPDGYREKMEMGLRDVVAPLSLPTVELRVASIFD
jgi:Uma2 family endonuclease